MKCLYEILGIDKEASQDEIKKAYRDLAKRHHPDKNKGEHSLEFLEIQQAYEILFDPEERATYDEFGFSGRDEEMLKIQALLKRLLAEFIMGKCKPYLLANNIEREIEDKLRVLKQNKKLMEESIDALRAQKDGLKIKDDSKTDILGQTILQMMNEIEADRRINDSEVKFLEKVLRSVGNYEKGVEETAGFGTHVRFDTPLSFARPYNF